MARSLAPTTRSDSPDGGAAVGGSGLSTFLLTDIEGSTRLWEDRAGAMSAALATHDRLLRAAIQAAGGTVVKSTGDGMLAVFEDPIAGVISALEAQRAVRDASWGTTGQLRVRMALHAGSAESRDGDFFGPALNRDARILAIGHGGQILLSAVTAVLARDRLPPNVELIDLGLHRLRDLDRPEQIYQLAAEDLPRDFPPLRSLNSRRTNLPIQLTSFVGRGKEVAEVEALVERGRLVTLIGTGGTGKTRLMLAAAERLVARFGDGAWIAELAPLGEASQIIPEIARALGVPDAPGRPPVETVSDFLAAKELLLLLDNAEHLVDGVADVADRLLAVAPGLRILATSREALRVPGELILQVPSLGCPVIREGATRTETRSDPSAALDAASGTEAVQLFAERAAAVLPAFEVTDENVEAVAEICRRLDGIPLALELAAARVSAMSPEEIAARLGDRFRLLTGGRRTAVPRQQTLQALIDWSWGLLDEDDRQLLRRLSVFAGGWTARSAAHVVGDHAHVAGAGGPTHKQFDDDAVASVVDGLARLIDRSLVVVDRGATTRYRMLETIRQYARERLIESGEAAAVADRHFRFFSAFAETAAIGLRGPAMGDWLDRLDADQDNLGVALEWSLEALPEAAVRMCDALFQYWRLRVAGPDAEARMLRAIAVAREIAAGPPAPTSSQLALAGRFLGHVAMIWGLTGRPGEAAPWAHEGLAMARSSGDRSAIIAALQGEVYVTVFSGTGANPTPLVREGLALAEEDEDWDTVATSSAMFSAGMARVDVEAAEALAAQASAAASRAGSPFTIAIVALGLGRMLGALGRADEARQHLELAIDRLTELGDQRLILSARSELGHALRRAGRFDEAAALYRDVLGGWIRFGNRGAVANMLEQSAFLAVDRGDPSRAATLLGAAEAIREAAGAIMGLDEAFEYQAFVARLRAEAPDVPVEAAWQAGRALTYQQAVELMTADAPAS
jgi:predicted ATPase/class 3 adenylate cyclase